MIAETVFTCAQQRLALQGHQQGMIEITVVSKNEGNFTAILRLLAKRGSDLERHLISSLRNAQNISARPFKMNS